MSAAVWTGPGNIETQQLPLPVLPEGWVLVRVEYTGLCGTDFSILQGTHPRAAAPLIMGHEITGVVETAVPDGPAVGTRVTVEPLIHCGDCHPCRHGNTHVCRNLGLYGIDVPGSLAEYVALPAGSLIPVGAGVPAREAALAEPLAVAVHAVDRSGLRGGERVVVFGAGPIGILVALVAKHLGAATVLISEPSEERAAVARSLGFETLPAGKESVQAVYEATNGEGADIVFDSAGHPAVAAVFPDVVRVRGTVVLVGVYKKPVELNLQALTFAENTVVGVRVYTRADVERAVELLETDVLGVGRIPIQEFALTDAAAAFDLAMSAGPALKVLVTSGPVSSGATEGPSA
ncbi:alcohol dehydrogenase catalytic domain-containing protein [Arthrobacter sp. Sa2CUA1]|uniref:Alcohol dehydrogenase catalytic domain-containing protein n=1 Tax=Arthrobacter gallicola TaxID=2762225 RepID=A0ABR8UTR7_9MICC|nr:alcohol dehydrogenase catalytic domain-containing protein [Arthrobacter gallicola]MBD7995966.1 alcohol dehydrogenase catalytic domain-containing protein [Arthrobacter gallicola]